MGNIVKYYLRGSIAVVVIDNPPVNALGQAVRAALVDALTQAESDPNVQAVLIYAQGRTFPVGSDIKEFGEPAFAPSLPAVCDRIEACTKPVITALHGTVFGGGFELALASHYRIAHVDTKMGLPEVALGLLPGAGGTLRAPQLCGVAFALHLMLVGLPVGAVVAKRRGLIDAITTQNILTAGLAMVQDIISQGAVVRRTLDRRERAQDPIANMTAIQQARERLADSALLAPAKIIDCVEAALLLPVEAGKAYERTAYEACLASDQSAALRHVFIAERMAGNVPERKSGKARDISNVGIVGGGSRGAGIAVSMLDSGLNVVLLERGAANLEAGLGRVAAIYAGLVAEDRITDAAVQQRLARLTGALSMADLADVDVAIEAVTEDFHIKEDVFARLDAVLKPGAILASNTSRLDIDTLATGISRPEDVIGLHCSMPINVMKLMEIVVADATSDDAVETGFALVKRLGKIGVRTGASDGFIGNRILKAYCLAAEYMVEDGASPYQVDRAMRGYGFGFGPFQVCDQVGLDIAWAARMRQAATRDPDLRYPRFGDKMCESGWFGQKVGRGYYCYTGQSQRGHEDLAVLDLIAKTRRTQKHSLRSFGELEIQRRCVCAMINEGMKLLEERIALRPSDIDVVMVHGHGFPRWRGGPMQVADQTGLLQLRRDLQGFDSEDTLIWQPVEMLDHLISSGQRFGGLNG